MNNKGVRGSQGSSRCPDLPDTGRRSCDRGLKTQIPSLLTQWVLIFLFLTDLAVLGFIALQIFL